MKKMLLLSAAALLLLLSGYAQNIAINADASLPNANAILDIKSGSKGLLIPRMDSVARKAIPNTPGLIVYDTTSNKFWYNTGTQWQSIATEGALAAVAPVAGGAWLLTGNSGTMDHVNFLGTTDNVPLNIRVNNQPSGRIDSSAENTFWGYFTGVADSSGNDNMGVGAFSLERTTTGSFNSASGARALIFNTAGSNNTANGFQSLFSNTTGSYNTANGVQAMFANTITSGLTATGYQSMYNNTTGANNTAYGYYTLLANASGSDNTATGASALQNNTSSDNTAFGFQALYFNTIGFNNVAFGSQALSNNTNGATNSAFGMQALFSNNGGGENTASGFNALYSNTIGSDNTGTGMYSLILNTTGNFNTGTGYSALTDNVTGSRNTAIGYYADVSTDGLTNATAIGANATVDASNKVRIGNSTVTVIEGQVPFTTPSDGRYKFNVQENVKGLDFILKLRPVTYQFDVLRFDARMSHRNGQENYAVAAAYDEAMRIRRSGFIAQEVETAANASGYDFSGIIKPKTDADHYSLSYDAFVVPLVKAIQEQQQIIVEQNRKIADLQTQIDDIKKLLK